MISERDKYAIAQEYKEWISAMNTKTNTYYEILFINSDSFNQKYFPKN